MVSIEDDRDKATSTNIKTALDSEKYEKILVLVGNNHVIQNIQWHEDLGKRDKKYLAGHLIADGVDVCSLQQLFSDSSSGNSVLVKSDTERGSALAMEVIKYVNHSDSMIGRGVSDAVVEWR